MNKELAYGVFELKKMESTADGSDLQATSGMVTMTRDNRICALSGSKAGVMTYIGTFDIKDNQLVVNIEASGIRELEGQTITREIEILDSENLVIFAGPPQNLKAARLVWKRTAKL